MYRVLIVDDEELIVERLRFGIAWQKSNFEVCGWAYDGQDAWEKIHQLYPDIVITDIRMPVMDGLELVRKIQLELPHISTIILSGHADFKYAQKAIKYQVEGYCLKPVIEEELITVLESVKLKQETNLKQQNQQLEMCAYDPDKLIVLLSGNGIDKTKPLYVIYGPDFHNQIAVTPCFTLKCGSNIRVWVINADNLPNVLTRMESISRQNNLTFGLSRVFKAEKGIQEALTEARIASYQWFIDQKSGLRTYPDARRRDLIAMLSSIDDDIRSTDSKRIEAAIATLYSGLFNGNYHIRHLLYAFNYILEAFKPLIEYCQNFQYEEDLVKNFAHMDELFSYLKQVLLCDARSYNGTIEISQVLEYLHKHFTEDLSLSSVAEEFFINSDYLCKVFRKETGQNFSKYVTMLRLHHACNLLQNTGQSLTK